MATDAPARVTRAARGARLNGIYAILNEDSQVVELAEAILDAGIGIVQYRTKTELRPETLRLLRALTRQRGALLLLNDDWRRAVEFDCDGVHLGPGDDGFEEPRTVRAAMPARLIGLSCGTAAEIARANEGDVDYLGVGPVFPTSSKADAGAPIGLNGLRHLARLTALPVAAIGGISAENLPEVRRCGVAMAALISALSAAPQPRQAAERLLAVWSSRV
jgi:thiamine-phosphate pyrophosphorylase